MHPKSCCSCSQPPHPDEDDQLVAPKYLACSHCEISCLCLVAAPIKHCRKSIGVSSSWCNTEIWNQVL